MIFVLIAVLVGAALGFVFLLKRSLQKRIAEEERASLLLAALKESIAAKDIDAVQAILITGADILPPKALASAKDWLSAQAVYLA